MPGTAAVRDDTAALTTCHDRPRTTGTGWSAVASRRLRRVALAGCCVSVALMVVSCTGSSPSAAGPTGTDPAVTGTSSPTTPASPSSTAAADRAAVEAAYRGFWPVVATFAESPESQWRAVLGRVAVDPQLSFAIAVTRTQRGNGITVYGQATPRAPKATLSGGQRAVVRDCADFSRTGQADARTGHPRTVGVARTPLSVTLLKGAGGRWRVSQVTFLGGRC
jgi:hypothetical protein